ncbi:Cupin domain protein [Blastococcus sp. DSM 46786]|uniref:cupin domain-containing protein n=1 Tax=Blastococcus sp. DSM 46786 TaxID=1798227 RepID=UPI0008C201CB|nr:cupin domain-containing protein [Blastococcus sp. DSM 46786]SEK57681.1 Cupin domain protein [Blastococcus sp. DSM 46786]
MSLHRHYPPDLYRGTTGEVSAWLRPAGGDPDTTSANGVTCEFLATGAETGGRFGLYRYSFGAEEAGPAPHFHRSISEQFYVLSGQVSVYDGRSWQDAGAGDFLYVPEGGIHAFRGGAHSSMLLMFAPGGPREEYFETLARGERMTPEERTEFMLRHDTYWL